MIELDGNHLTIDQIVRVANEDEQINLSDIGQKNIEASHQLLQGILAMDKPVYGINTGFGIFADQRIPISDSSKLSRNLILSHAVGTGIPFSPQVVRAAMLVRANTLSKGYSGVRTEIVKTLLSMLNACVVPEVPSQGSLGSSGDLIPLSHLALVFTTDTNDFEAESGWAIYQGQRLSGKAAMIAAGIPRIVLGAKEGLAINNGATFSAAIAALNLYEATYLIEVADSALAMSLETVMGCKSAFDARLQQARGQLGQMRTAEHVLELIQGSTLINHAGRVQDAYSLRCAPQVHGIARDTVEFCRGVINHEINAATDNPLIFENGEALSGGNFHGEPIGQIMDYLSITISELAAISERRTFRLLDEKLNGGLPPMLVDRPENAGLNSGLMMPQYTAASLVLENQTLATPDSVHSLPTSGEQEDHNANSLTAAVHTSRIIQNTLHVLGIELYTAARALDLRLRYNPDLKMGQGTRLVYENIRRIVPYKAGDAWWGPEIGQVCEMISSRDISSPFVL